MGAGVVIGQPMFRETDPCVGTDIAFCELSFNCVIYNREQS